MATPLDPAAFAATMPFAVTNGVELTAVTAEAVVGHLDWAEARCTIGGLDARWRPHDPRRLARRRPGLPQPP